MPPATHPVLCDHDRFHSRTYVVGMQLLLIPLLLIVGLVVIVVLWVWTGPIIALVTFAALCSLGASIYQRQRRKSLGLPPKN
jgi:uncharacterized membrane protein